MRTHRKVSRLKIPGPKGDPSKSSAVVAHSWAANTSGPSPSRALGGPPLSHVLSFALQR